MTEQELKIKIVTMAEKVGLEQTIKALEGITSQSGSAEKASASAAKGINLIASASAAASGSINGFIGAIVQLLAKMGLSITVCSGVGAALLALVAVGQSVAKVFDRVKNSIADIKMGNLEKSIAALTKEQDKFSAALERSNALREAELQFVNAKIDGEKNEALALNELAKQRELMQTTDPDKRAIIEARYQLNAGTIAAGYDSRKGAELVKASRAGARKDSADAMALSAARDNNIDLIIKAASELESAESTMQNTNNPLSKFANFVGFSSSRKDAQAKIERATKIISDLTSLSAQQDQAAKDLFQSSANKNREADVIEKQNKTDAAMYEASGMAGFRAVQDARRIEQENKAKADQERRDAEKKAKDDSERAELEKQRNATQDEFFQKKDVYASEKDRLENRTKIERKEYDQALDIAESYKKKGDIKNYQKWMKEAEKQRAEAEAVAAELAEFTVTMISTLKWLTESIRNLNEQIKRIGQQ